MIVIIYFQFVILDVSGSMEKYYSSLINMANNIIREQQKNEKNRGVVIFLEQEQKLL